MFIGRKEDGTIYGLWTVKQWKGQEELPADHPEVAGFTAEQEERLQAMQSSKASSLVAEILANPMALALLKAELVKV